MTNVVAINTKRDRLWNEFVSAQRRAQMSLDLADGIEAGHAWRRWLEVYMTPEQRDFLGGKEGAQR